MRKLIAVFESLEKLPVYSYDLNGAGYGLQVKYQKMVTLLTLGIACWLLLYIRRFMGIGGICGLEVKGFLLHEI